MSDWADGINRHIETLDGIGDNLVPAIAAATHESIVVGSAVTGSPGQPVGQYGSGYHPGKVGGELRTSWTVRPIGDDVWEIATNAPHAPPNETGVTHDGRPYTQRSTVGGRHSLALTRTNFDRLVDHVANEGIRPAGFTDNSALNDVGAG